MVHAVLSCSGIPKQSFGVFLLISFEFIFVSGLVSNTVAMLIVGIKMPSK